MDDGRRQLSRSELEALLAIGEQLRKEDQALAESLARGVLHGIDAARPSPGRQLLKRLTPGVCLILGAVLVIVSSALSDMFILVVGAFCVVTAFLRHTQRWTDSEPGDQELPGDSTR